MQNKEQAARQSTITIATNCINYGPTSNPSFLTKASKTMPSRRFCLSLLTASMACMALLNSLFLNHQVDSHRLSEIKQNDMISPLAEGGCDAKWINPMKKRVEENPEPTKLTKKIFILWQQGFENAPEIVQIIRDSWIVKNPTWEVIQVTDDNVKNLLEGTDFDALFGSKLSSGNRETRAAFSDVIRLFLLEKYGGVWADASALCTVPLDSWLPFIVDDDLDFFGFRAMKYNLNMKKEYFPLSSWFLYGTPKSPIIQKWKKEMISYWDGRTVPHAYFWLHYNLFHVFEQDNDLARKWMQSAILDRNSAHDWKNSNPVGKSCSGFLGSAPVQKLSHYSKASLFMSYLEAVEENQCGLCVDGTDCNKDSVELFESLKTWCKA